MSGEQLAALELEHRLANAEKTISELQQQLKEAEEIIKFYADTNNWTESHSVVFTDIIKDSEWLKRTDEHGNNNVDWEVGGKRARAYLSKRKEV